MFLIPFNDINSHIDMYGRGGEIEKGRAFYCALLEWQPNRSCVRDVKVKKFKCSDYVRRFHGDTLHYLCFWAHYKTLIEYSEVRWTWRGARSKHTNREKKKKLIKSQQSKQAFSSDIRLYCIWNINAMMLWKDSEMVRMLDHKQMGESQGKSENDFH